MNKKVLDFVNKLEGYKTAIKQLHWDAKNMSQHELCDDIADSIAEFQDTVSEVEQSITGNLKVNSLKPTEYKIKDLKSFVQDVLDETNTFYKEVKDMGDTYVGMASDCESFLSDMQRKLYLVNFTLKEELKERLKAKINESMPKNLANHDEVDKFMGRKPKSIKARINQIYRVVKKYGIDSKIYHDENWQAIEDYYRAISSLGCEVEMKPCASLSNADSMESDGGYTDYDPYDNMPRSKQYAIKIMFEDGMNIDGYIKCMAAGTVSDPFSRYDTCIVLWPKNNRVLEDKEMRNESINEYGDTPEVRKKMGRAALRGILKGDVKPYQNAMNSLNKRRSQKEDYKDFQKGFENENRHIKLSEAELKQVVKEAAMKILSETPLNYDIDNFSGRWNKIEPSDEELALADSAANGDYLDNPFNPPNSWDDDDWVDGDKDMENDYSWDLYHRMNNNVGKSPIDRQHDVMDAAQDRRDHAAYWTDKDNERGRKLMDKWINGKRDTDELGDVDFSYDPYKYNESKEPMKVTEAELKQVIKEATIKLINEIGDTPKGREALMRLSGRRMAQGSWLGTDLKRNGIEGGDDKVNGYFNRGLDAANYADAALDKEIRKAIGDKFHLNYNDIESIRDIIKKSETENMHNAYKDEFYGYGENKYSTNESKESKIEIEPSKKGTFTAAATKHGKSVQGFANQVLKNKENYSPAMVKKANFAKNFGGKK